MTTTEKIQNAIEKIIDGYASQYINVENENGEELTIRVANHPANPSRMDLLDISLVVEVEESQDDEYTNWCINKKSFRSISNQYFLDTDGDFTENFRNLGEMLEYHEIAL